jgi:hypothetical protein
MPTSEIKCRIETWNDSADVDAGHGNDARIRLSGSRMGYLFFGLPFPFAAGMTINSATLHVWAAGGSTSISAVKAIDERWRENGPGRLTWENQPAVRGSSAGSGSASGEITIDVTSLIDDVAAGTNRWHGLRLEGSGNIFSSDSADPDSYPMLEVDWDLPVGYTVDLTPSAMRAVDEPAPALRWAGPSDTKHRVVMSKKNELDEDGKLKDPFYESRWAQGSVHELADKKSFPKLRNGDVVHWQVAMQNKNGTPGPWSSVASFTYLKRGAVKITSPASTTHDATPVIKHTATSQKAVQYIVSKDGRVLYDTGYVVTDQKSYELPEGIVTDGQYEVTVRVWDDIVRYRNRATEATKKFTFKSSDKVNAPQDVQFIKSTSPGVKLLWRGTADKYDIKMNDVLLARVNAEDVNVGDDKHLFTVRRNEIPEQVEIQIAAVQGRASSILVPLTIANAVLNKWLSTSTIDVVMIGDDPAFNLGSDEAIFVVPGRRDPVQVLQTERGYEGSFSGSLSAYPPEGVTSDQQRDNFLAIYAARGTTEIRFAWRNIDIPILMTNVAGPITHTKADWYDVSFDFQQVGDYTFTPA